MAGTEEPMWGDLVLEIRDISLSLGATTVLRNLSLDVGDGEVVAIHGPSGSGKSTLLRVIAGLIAPDAGHILLDAAVIDDVPTHRRDIGLVFQDEQLFAHRSVNRNIEFGLRMRHWKQSDRAVRVREMLELVGLAGFGERRVTDLSGGEAKRVALVRTLAPFPKIVLLDEPLTGLDRPLHDQLAKELGRLLRVTGTSALLVTHDHEEAEVIADRVVSLTRPS
jgi:thiamine transport system ATP-binding protein